jgi:3'(2'), 5'-bisphosphate nucleotidase
MPGCDDWAVHIALWQRSGAGGPATLGAAGPDGGLTDAVVALPARAQHNRPTADHPGSPAQ